MWAVDFQFDATTDGRPIKIVSIIDEHTRECLGGLVERSITGENLIAELDWLGGPAQSSENSDAPCDPVTPSAATLCRRSRCNTDSW
jgi:hypothetical protein